MRALLQKKILEYSSAIKEMKISPEVVKGFEKEGIVSVERERCYRTPLPKTIPAEKKAVLNEEQQQAVREILEEWDSQVPQRQNRSLYGAYPSCAGAGKTGDPPDTGNRADLSECIQILRQIRRTGVPDPFQDVSGRTVRSV